MQKKSVEEAANRIIPNYAKRKLRENKLIMGMGVTLMRGSAPGLLAKANGYDFIFIDMEHGGTSVDDAGRIATAALPTGVTPLVRCCREALQEATRVLDNGAHGVVVPHVDTADTAREIVSRYRFPPQGTRSITNLLPQYSFGLSFDDSVSFRDKVTAMNDEILVVAMIESPEAVDNADAIAAVEGIDVLMIGAHDLAASMDLYTEMGHPKMRAAFAKVGKACQRHNKSWGMGGVYVDAILHDYYALGARFILAINDHQAFMAGSSARAKSVRALELEPA